MKIIDIILRFLSGPGKRWWSRRCVQLAQFDPRVNSSSLPREASHSWWLNPSHQPWIIFLSYNYLFILYSFYYISIMFILFLDIINIRMIIKSHNTCSFAVCQIDGSANSWLIFDLLRMRKTEFMNVFQFSIIWWALRTKFWTSHNKSSIEHRSSCLNLWKGTWQISHDEIYWELIEKHEKTMKNVLKRIKSPTVNFMEFKINSFLNN